jgi:hypothetical protein
MKLLAAPALVVTLLIALVPGQLRAAGDRSTVATPVADARGDSSPGHVDIKSVTVAGTEATITWTIVAYGSFATAKAPCVDIVSVLPGGLHWAICGTAGKGFGIDTSSPYPRGGGYSGTASVSRPNPATVVYRVKRAYITKGGTLKPQPHGYAWQAQVRDQPGCMPRACDSAPDATRVALPG